MTRRPAPPNAPRPTPADPLTAALKILGVKPNNVQDSATRENGDFVAIVNQGQKFVFTPKELADPKVARARLRAEGRTVIPPLDPTKKANARPDDGLPDDGLPED
jgi:hypothetical protein